MSAQNKCWCGVENPYYAPLEHGCGGSGVITCYCGGDLCVCHWHGEVQCGGCEDCQEMELDDDYDPEEERRNEYTMQAEDEILRRVDP